ncbi:EboA domain-containing protein [Salegentibacter sp. F188]|uniref:EboA domain-containing protein n=1 Tax=Autumnicola patrickiae TaxID=3075591 RepID=A0ABU3E0U0_9FLAO|nr:EboA domain-containing protein [Salegentibacter sp. F188]MDT0689586.1 EboA domain-containing protein [Salegentibacter sp. F188]
MTFQVDLSQTSHLLKKIIEGQASEKELEWLDQKEEKLRNNFQVSSFYIAFSSASRFVRKDPLILSEEQLTEADRIRNGFQPQYFNLLQCVRISLLLMLPHKDKEEYEATIQRLHETADMDEQVTLYCALPLLPYPEEMSARAAEGIRTNITDVFDAIALNNPYPADYLDQQAWNQMILKAVFMQRPLYKIYRAEDRANPELAGMLIDFAHERWAANRKVLPELWRFVGPFLNESYFADIKKVINGNNALEKDAGLLACENSEFPAAKQLLDQYPKIKNDIESGKLNWTVIGKRFEEELQK